MQLQVTVRDIESTPAIEAQIKEKADKLHQYFDGIIACKVSIELVQKHQHVGQLYSAHIQLSVPGRDIVATHNAAENLWIAIRDAFNNARDQLQSYVEQIRHQVKTHSDEMSGKIVRLLDDFGFILSSDGLTEYYFNATHVVTPTFEKLEIGMPVHFITTIGNEGPQARRVSVRKSELEKQASAS